MIRVKTDDAIESNTASPGRIFFLFSQMLRVIKKAHIFSFGSDTRWKDQQERTRKEKFQFSYFAVRTDLWIVLPGKKKMDIKN